jgi:hypothetical protein
VLVVDDADALDAESRSVLEQLARGDARPELDVRVLLVRESTVAPDEPTVAQLDVAIAPLGADQAVRLLADLAEVEHTRAAALAIRAGGLPSVLVELVSGTSRKIDAPWPRLHGLGDATRVVLEATSRCARSSRWRRRAAWLPTRPRRRSTSCSSTGSSSP